MDDRGIFVLKLLLISAGVSAAIKYWVPLLHIPATPEVALIFVFTPPLLLGSLLIWRGWQQNQQDKN